MLYFHISVIVIILYLGQNCLFSFVCLACMLSVWLSVLFACRCVLCWTNRGLVKLWVFYSKFLPNSNYLSELLISFIWRHPKESPVKCIYTRAKAKANQLLVSCDLSSLLLSTGEYQGDTWILLYLGRTMQEMFMEVSVALYKHYHSWALLVARKESPLEVAFVCLRKKFWEGGGGPINDILSVLECS